jgi:CRP-like cAMP-binding protein
MDTPQNAAAARGATLHQLAGNIPCYSVLKQIAPFSAVGDDKLARLRGVVRLHYRRRAAIIATGARAGGVYVLLSGEASNVIEDAQGRAMTLSTIARNELFGDLGLPCDALPCSGVSAISECETLYIPGASFLACIDGHYEAAMVMLRLTAARLRAAQIKVATLGLLGVYERVALLLVDSAEWRDGQWVVDTGAEDIARTVAASREMVSRVVKLMHARGLVCREKRKLLILDWRAMNAACVCLHGASLPI